MPSARDVAVTFQPDFSSARMMKLRSKVETARSSRFSVAAVLAYRAARRAARTGRSSSVIQSLSETATSRSIRFSSSRMLPGPPVRAEDLQRRIGDALDVLAELDVVAAEEEPRQLRQILDAIAQRRHPDRDHVEPVVQVLAEPPFLDRLLEIDVGGGDESEIRLDRMRAADALDLFLLDRAQQLGLQLVAQIADLVEEQRAAGGQLELAELLPDRAGERALLVSEERALDELPAEWPRGSRRRTARSACPTRDGSAARAAPCRCRSRRG